MKKHFLYLLAASMTLSGTTLFTTSCGDDDPTIVTPSTPSDPGDTPTPSNPQGNKKLTSVEQKQKLESIAKAFMGEVKANNFSQIADLADYCFNHYVDNDDFDEDDVISEWFEDALNASTSLVKAKTERSGSWVKDTKLYDRTIMLANFTGHFTAQKNSWKKEKASDLQFNFTDQDGKACNITVTSSGSTKKAYISDSEDWYDYNYDKASGTYTDYINKYKNYVMVPEQITISLTQNGVKQVATVLNINHSEFTGPELDLSRDGLSTNVTVNIANFTWCIQRAEYSVKSHKAGISGYMKKNDNVMLKFSADANDIEANNEDLNKAGSASINFDLLGQLQIKGSCSNVKAYADLLEKADDNDENETLFKSYLSQAQELTDISVFYDKGSVKQAGIKLMAFKEESAWNPANSYWYADPVIQFDDGTTYSTFSAYFDESDFRSVIDTFNNLIEGYEKLFDR